MPQISRADAAKIIGSQKATDIVDIRTEQSVVLSTFPQVRLSKATYTQNMLASLPDAQFVGERQNIDAAETGTKKPTTKMTWTDKSMTVAEVAVIVPIHENVLADADIDILGEIRPKVTEAFGLRVDAAVLYGESAPAAWTDANIVGKAVAAGNRVQNPLTGTQTDLAEQFNQLFARIEDDDFDVTDVLAVKSLRSRFRGLRDADGRPVYVDNYRTDDNTSSIYGQPLSYLHRRIARPTVAEAIALDRSQYLVGIREDIQVKFLDQATIGGVNLAEEDMVALRFKFRLAFGSFSSPLGVAGGYPAAVLSPRATA